MTKEDLAAQGKALLQSNKANDISQDLDNFGYAWQYEFRQKDQKILDTYPVALEAYFDSIGLTKEEDYTFSDVDPGDRHPHSRVELLMKDPGYQKLQRELGRGASSAVSA